ncbi:MAG: tail fiber domain-containing protein, partial [Bacteroidota bacterium]
NGNASKSGGGSWSNFSDRRLKKDIKPFTDGLEQVLQIDPIIYRYNGKAGIATKDLQIGIIAQDMQKIAPYMVEEADFGEEENDKNAMNYLVYNPSALDYLFVNAFKEQQAQIEEKDELIEAQNEKIEDLETRLVKLEQLILQSSNTQTIELNATHNTTYLKQNQPNPFSKATLIEYAVPEEVNESKIVFTDLNGSVIKIVAVNGIGQLEITTPNFSTGTYTYSLVIDGKVVTTNKMVLVK